MSNSIFTTPIINTTASEPMSFVNEKGKKEFYSSNNLLVDLALLTPMLGKIKDTTNFDLDDTFYSLIEEDPEHLIKWMCTLLSIDANIFARYFELLYLNSPNSAIRLERYLFKSNLTSEDWIQILRVWYILHTNESKYNEFLEFKLVMQYKYDIEDMKNLSSISSLGTALSTIRQPNIKNGGAILSALCDTIYKLDNIDTSSFIESIHKLHEYSTIYHLDKSGSGLTITPPISIVDVINEYCRRIIDDSEIRPLEALWNRTVGYNTSIDPYTIVVRLRTDSPVDCTTDDDIYNNNVIDAVTVCLTDSHADDINEAFKNKFFKYTSNTNDAPDIVLLTHFTSLFQKIKELDSWEDECSVPLTSISKTLDHICGVLVATADSEQIPPQNILIITNEQFDSKLQLESALEKVSQKYKDANIEMPRLLVWNVYGKFDAIQEIPTDLAPNGITLLSGINPLVVQAVLTGGKGQEEFFHALLDEQFKETLFDV